MSYWASMYVWFKFEKPLSPSDLERLNKSVPRGSESGSDITQDHNDPTEYSVSDARLRDTEDSDAPAILGWFTKVCGGWPVAEHAYLEMDFDAERGDWPYFRSGPRYRFEWKDGKLTKLRGMLDW